MSETQYYIRDPYWGPVPVLNRSKPYDQWTHEEKLKEYDQHNGMTRKSKDPQERMYGKCGCRNCAATRKQWANFPAPVNTPGRKGSDMSSINLCDRCESMATGVAIGAVQVRTSADYDEQEIISKEICPGCVEELLMFLDMKPGPRKQRAYKEPYKRAKETDDVDAATTEQLAAALLEKLMKAQNAKAIEGTVTDGS